MADKMEVQKMNTAVSQWTNSVTNLVTKDFELCGVPFDEYSKQCAMSAMSSIWQLVKDSDKVKDLSGLDTSNLREVVGQCASLKLNANAVPRECYFQLRTKKVGSDFVQVVEMGIEGDGNDAMLRNYGENVDTVYPCWLVKEGDVFEYPKHKGIEMTPPEWEEKGLSQKVIRVVYPLKLKDGTFQYLIAERDGVKVNLFAHVRNNLMNETFGLLGMKKDRKGNSVPRTRYDATPDEKKQIDTKKEEIFEALRKCTTVDEMLECEIAKPCISAAWLDTPESMIVRKMRNNAVKKYRKDFNSTAKQSFNQLDETYQQTQEEIAENANSEEFVVDAEATDVPENESAAVEQDLAPQNAEVVDGNDADVPDFLK